MTFEAFGHYYRWYNWSTINKPIDVQNRLNKCFYFSKRAFIKLHLSLIINPNKWSFVILLYELYIFFIVLLLWTCSLNAIKLLIYQYQDQLCTEHIINNNNSNFDWLWGGLYHINSFWGCWCELFSFEKWWFHALQ